MSAVNTSRACTVPLKKFHQKSGLCEVNKEKYTPNSYGQQGEDGNE